MGLKIGDNFSYQARKPLDERLVYETLSDMTSLPDSVLYEGLIAYNKETFKFYSFNSNNPIDVTLGKWREFAGDDSHKFTAEIDTNVNSPTQGHLIITFLDGTTQDCGYVLGSNIATITEYQENTEYQANSILYLGNKFVRVLTNYTTGNIVTTLEDLLNNDTNVIVMSHDVINDTVPDLGTTYSSTKIETLLQGVSSTFEGSCRTDNAADLPQSPNIGTWVLVENCVNNFPGQAGIAVYQETGWNIAPLPSATFTFPEPTDDNKPYFRTRLTGDQEGYWSVLNKIDGNNIELKLKIINGTVDTTFIPTIGELVLDTSRDCLIIGDGTTTAAALRPFYEVSISNSDIVSALGYTPEDIADKGQANGYAPLDNSGKVPAANLPASLTDTYSKAEIDQKDTNTLAAATLLVNQEAAQARANETSIQTDLSTHTSDMAIHVTQTEKDNWNNKVDLSDLTDYDNHISDNTIHVTQSDKDKWNGMNKVYYVLSVNDLPSTGNSIGNLGYVQISAANVTPVVCDTYLWNGTKWVQQDVNQVTLQMKWGNLADRPSSTVLAIDNAVDIAHNHTNKTVLEKIGQTSTGSFTFNGQEIGVRIVFCANESLLPPTGEEDTLYVIYEDSRVRKYPSISIWHDNSYQILGRGTQDTPQIVGDMSILQNEFFSVAANTKQRIKVTSNQYFAFLPLEILKEIPGKTNQNRNIATFDNPDDYEYDSDLINISSTKLSISIAELPTEIYDVKDQYLSSVNIDLSKYKEIEGIM